MIELPYGIADFNTIRSQGLAYVDRTAYIRVLEQRGRPLVLLRPRRFGKSLWLADFPGRLRIPNLVVRKLFLVAVGLERMLGEER